MHFLRKADRALVRVQDEALETSEGIHFLMQEPLRGKRSPASSQQKRSQAGARLMIRR